MGVGTLGEAVEHRILYIEDNSANVALIKQLVLTVYGLDIANASSAKAGIAAIHDDPPSLILLDINLPQMNGFKAIGHIREIESMASVPIVGLSAHAMPADIQKAKDAGFDDYLTKPVDVQTAIGVLNKYLT